MIINVFAGVFGGALVIFAMDWFENQRHIARMNEVANRLERMERRLDALNCCGASCKVSTETSPPAT